ncbi:vacuolar protein sorting-associated protein [Grosmannia clavigera kw1407]|uniref:Vacuolar protein sorting-associated protein n=1 Tax=Grosmannia clavigera (strain kw1407 / UAMH 11150) TaxID=655863 RepID=F0XPQ6_GROCL|nr:vacuolar protein sorting-associated protein [Grosmannia clavigera kw1407]EFX00270.1 vacuolar protein sorting-associated protein [Grosmannia clavigera kw1407]
MDLFQAVSGYVTRMVTAGDSSVGTGGLSSGSSLPSSVSAKMKILLLDRETVPIVSTAVTQSALLNHEVYLIDRLDNAGREKMRHLRCYCFVRPSAEAIQQLVEELRDPRYGEYNLFFSNVVKKSSMERLAEADDHEVVKRVQEYFADFVVINPDLFSLDFSIRGRMGSAKNSNSPITHVWGASPDAWNADALQRSTEGVLAALLALKKKPLIRYARSSLLAKKLATEVRYRIAQEEQQLFDFRPVDTPPILLIVDRREDPITPLLTQWTYQAMVHQMFGIHNGRVDLQADGDGNGDGDNSNNNNSSSDPASGLRETVLSQDQDPFFKRNMFLNFGDLGSNVKEYVEQFQARHKNNENLESISDMKRFVEEYPEFRKLSGNVSKHVHLISELSRRVNDENLLEVSECEQSIVCNDNHAADLKTIQKLIQSPTVSSAHKVGLVALYALRYEKQPQSGTTVAMLVELLTAAGGVPSWQADLVAKLLAYEHSLQHRSGGGAGGDDGAGGGGGIAEIFESSGIFGGGAKALRGLKGVDNVYTMHSPLLETTLHSLVKGRLREQQYPFVDGGGATRDKPQDIIVFAIGGTTYEEAKAVAGLNASTPGVRIVLGGTTVHNATSFWDEIDSAVSSWPEPPPNTTAGRLRKELGRRWKEGGRKHDRRKQAPGTRAQLTRADPLDGHVSPQRLATMLRLTRRTTRAATETNGCGWGRSQTAAAVSTSAAMPQLPRSWILARRRQDAARPVLLSAAAVWRRPGSLTRSLSDNSSPSRRENIYTVPNMLTVARLAAAPFVGYCILHDMPGTALGLLAAAGVSDLLDGWIARRWQLRTVVGSIIDPMADKVLMTVLAVSLAAEGGLPLWLAALILGRDAGLAIAAVYYRWVSLPPPKTLARYWDFSLPSAEVRPTTISKYNTFLQLALMATTTAAPVAASAGLDLATGLTAMQYVVAGTTVWSGLSYVYSKDAVKILSQDRTGSKSK